MALINTTTNKEFEDAVTNSDKTVLVDFWAEWCPPCRAMAPTLHDLANELDKTVDIVKVNIESSADNQRLAGEHGVQSIPNMVIFKGGKEAGRIIGMTPKAALADELQKVSQG